MDDGEDVRHELAATLATLARLGRDVAYLGLVAADGEAPLAKGVLRRQGRRIAGLARQGGRPVRAPLGQPRPEAMVAAPDEGSSCWSTLPPGPPRERRPLARPSGAAGAIRGRRMSETRRRATSGCC